MITQEKGMRSDAQMRRAVRDRDATADSEFFYAVLSTGVFCFPSCAARPARPENLRFFATREAAERAGYRACRRCRPDLPPRPDREAAMVDSACRAIDSGCFHLAASAEAACISQAQFARIFRRRTGATLAAYDAAYRRRLVQAGLRGTATITDIMYEAGFSSSGRFYEAAPAMLGMTPTAFRRGGAGVAMMHACAGSSLGRVLVAATERGICAILIGDSDDALAADLARRFPKAALTPAWPAFEQHIANVIALIDAPKSGHALPLDIRGTTFQLLVWNALRAIPPGTTLSYGAIAAQLGKPRAARAVAAACAANRLAVAIPCHRAVNAHGELAGYRWGIERKKVLLETEKEGAQLPNNV